MRIPHVEYRNVLRGLGLGLFIATGLSAWATFLRLSQGTAPFERIGIPYAQAVLVYYGALGLGGAVVGALLPLRRWALGSMLLGFLLLAPMYASSALLYTLHHPRFSTWIALGTLAASIIVGGGLGLWVWSNEQKGRG